MIEAVFLRLLNMSITASWIVLAVVILRLLLRRAPKAVFVVCWAMVGVRLICPLSFESALSLIPSTETVPADIFYADVPAINSGISSVDSGVNSVISGALAPNLGDSANPAQILAFAASVVWLAGVTVMLAYTAISYYRIRSKVRESVPLGEVYVCDRIATPFILGVFRPRIYLPSALPDEDAEYVIAHEKAHLRRRDHLLKPIGFLLLSVYWFNPVIWLAYILFCRDIELACDESVIRDLGTEIKKPYSTALINCSVQRSAVAACPLAFGEVGVKERIKSVLSYKKPALWVIVASAAVCTVAALCFLTNPAKSTPDAAKKKQIAPNFSVTETGSDLNTFSVSVESVGLDAERPYIEVKWKNTGRDDLVLGEYFDILYHKEDGWVSCCDREDMFFTDIGLLVPAFGVTYHKYYVADFDLSKSGMYKLEFDVEKGSAYIIFELSDSGMTE